MLNYPAGVFALVGIGGAGKTAIVQHSLSKLPHSKIGSRADKLRELASPDAMVVWSFYEEPDADAFCTALYEYLTHKAPERITVFELQKALEQWQGSRVLLVLDGLEKMRTGAPSDQEEKHIVFGTFHKLASTPLTTLLRWVAAGQQGISAIVTSRFPLTDLHRWENSGYIVISVDDLPWQGALTLLRDRRVRGNDSDLESLLLDRFLDFAIYCAEGRFFLEEVGFLASSHSSRCVSFSTCQNLSKPSLF
jgi:hypothetical protein